MGLRPSQNVTQEPLLYLDGSTVFLYAGLRIARKMKASVLTSVVTHLFIVQF